MLHFESASNKPSLRNKQTENPNTQNRSFQKEGSPDLISPQALLQLWPEVRQNTLGRCLSPASPDWHRSPWIREEKDKWVTSQPGATVQAQSQITARQWWAGERDICFSEQCRNLTRTQHEAMQGCTSHFQDPALTHCSPLSELRLSQVDFSLALVFISVGN